MTDRLPIHDIEDQIVARLRQSPRIILQAPTGSGKSTQVPQILLDHGFLETGQAVVLQPQPLAARLLASRVARKRGVELGMDVGYYTHRERVAGPATKILYVTEEALLTQMRQDPELRGVKAVILDEFHERRLFSDITLARVLALQKGARPELLLVVMAPVLQAGLVERYLEPCDVVTFEGRTFPVESEYLPQRTGEKETAVWDLAADAFQQHVRAGRSGDVLVFMPGGYEVQQTIESIRQTPESKDFVLLPLHGELSPAEQDAAVAPHDQPKVVVATEIAETSLGIEGIRLVIDSGLAPVARHDGTRGINRQLVEKISRASADQRAARAGGIEPGRCVRLWASQEHWERPEHDVPEVQRLDLSQAVLTLRATGFEDARQFPWLEAPSEKAFKSAEDLLLDLGALEAVEGEDSKPDAGTPPQAASEAPPSSAPAEVGTATEAGTGPAEAATATPEAGTATAEVQAAPRTIVTELGRKLLSLPVHPRHARMLLAAQDYGCVYHACLAAALAEGGDLFVRNPGKGVDKLRDELFGHKASSDFKIFMRAWIYARDNDFGDVACRKAGIHAGSAWHVQPALERFLGTARSEGLAADEKADPGDSLAKCILVGFPDRLARRLDVGTLRCELVGGRRASLARESAVQQSPLLVAVDVREVEAADKTMVTLLTLATGVQLEWLRELFPQHIRVESRVYFEPTDRRVLAEEQVRFRGLTVGSRRIDPPPADAAAKMLAGEVIQKRLTLRNWDDTVEGWILRLNLLSKWCPELGLSPLGSEDRHHLIEQICEGASSYKAIKDREVQPVVQSWLSGPQRELLDKHAPERFVFPNGPSAKVHYSADEPPYIEVRLHELYGIRAKPRIAMAKITLFVHILGPNMRPLLITQDLATFWREQYPKMKRDLYRKFPKHEWR